MHARSDFLTRPYSLQVDGVQPTVGLTLRANGHDLADNAEIFEDTVVRC